MTRVEVVTGTNPAGGADLSLKPGVNVTTGERAFFGHFGAPTTLEVDLLTLAASVYCADLALKRGRGEDIARNIQVTVPVTNLPAFLAIRDPLVYALYRLSHDAWEIRFTQRSGALESPVSLASENGKVLLFSGGLDSLAGAIHLGEARDRVVLVSHVTANQVVARAQDDLASYVDRAFVGQFTRRAFRVGGVSRPSRGFAFPSDQDREETQRTRSFLFLALAALVARRERLRDIVLIAENGQMAIHLPLSAARIGAFSTHTAHPEFLHVASDLFSRLLQYDIRIENPFVYLTKAQVVSAVVRGHREVVAQSVSCWKASRLSSTHRHCGFCIPCLLRRIALETNGLHLAEYQRDLLGENLDRVAPDDDGKRNLVELGEFVQVFASNRSQAEVESLYPDLVNPHFDAIQATSMYNRFAREARAVFQGYPHVNRLLS